MQDVIERMLGNNTVSGWMPRQRTQRRTGAVAGISLLKRRHWYSDDGGGGADAPPPDSKGADTPPSSPVDSDELARLQAENQKLIDRNRQLSGEAGLRRKEKELALEETGNWERLAKEREVEITRLQAEVDRLKPHQARSEALLEEIRARNEELIAKIPDAKRSMVPEHYTPEQKSAWLHANFAELTTNRSPDIDVGAGGGGGGPPAPSNASERDQAAANIVSAHGIKIEPEAIARRRAAIEARRKQTE